ncbi:hypothetical protein [Limnobacter sp.]|uniref:hypothetical protein n=1 Tax=Limnobacter sp. TaxID=2003368 RepID=UPI0035173D18
MKVNYQVRVVHCARKHSSGFIQAALLFGIALITAVLGGFALANRSPTSQTDSEQAKVNASVILKQASDLRDGVARYASDFGSTAVINTLDMSNTSNVGLFDPQPRYASPQIMPRSTFRDPNSTYATIKTPSATSAGHWFINKATPGNSLATASADPMVILPGLKQDVCGRVNTLLYGSATIPASTAAIADWIGGANGGISAVAAVSGWPEGCVATSDATTEYVYFKAIQEN